MRIPYSIQGALFAPTLILLLFVLKMTCPAPTGAGCFADAFLLPMFMPLLFVYRVFGREAIVVAHEPIFILLYWMCIGLCAGMLADLYNKKTG